MVNLPWTGMVYGGVHVGSSVVVLVSLLVYRRFVCRLSSKSLMLCATLVSVPHGLTQLILVTCANVSLGPSDQFLALADNAALPVLGYVAFTPTKVLVAQLCRPGVEDTLFAALMSIHNASGAASSEPGALLIQLLGVTEKKL